MFRRKEISLSTSHSAYDATSTKLYEVKIDEFLIPKILKKYAKSSSAYLVLKIDLKQLKSFKMIESRDQSKKKVKISNHLR